MWLLCKHVQIERIRFDVHSSVLLMQMNFLCVRTSKTQWIRINTNYNWSLTLHTTQYLPVPSDFNASLFFHLMDCMTWTQLKVVNKSAYNNRIWVQLSYGCQSLYLWHELLQNAIEMSGGKSNHRSEFKQVKKYDFLACSFRVKWRSAMMTTATATATKTTSIQLQLWEREQDAEGYAFDLFA